MEACFAKAIVGKMMGTVKNFNLEKGFGFLLPDGGGEDVFAHSKQLLDGNALRPNARVCFRTEFARELGHGESL